MRRLPPLGAIQAFVHAAHLGSIKGAADSLALSAPALTRRIQSLEQFIGTSLFERQNNSVQLNETGSCFLADIEPHIDALASAVERVRGNGRMRLRLAAPSLFASQRLMPALGQLRLDHPDLVIEVDTGGNRISRLTESIDVAIAITDKVDQKLYSRVLERGTIVAIGSADVAASISHPSSLRSVPILLHRDMPTALSAWLKGVGIPDFSPRQTSFFDAGQLILDAAAEGLGVAFMLDSHLKHSTDERLVRVFEESVASPYAYWFVCGPSALDRLPISIFHDWLFERFPMAD